jgi:hypothetical protein
MDVCEYDRDDFFSYLTDFSYFILERNRRKLLDTVSTSQKWIEYFTTGHELTIHEKVIY